MSWRDKLSSAWDFGLYWVVVAALVAASLGYFFPPAGCSSWYVPDSGMLPRLPR